MKLSGISSLAITLALVGIVSAQDPPQIGLGYGDEKRTFVDYGTCIHVTPDLKRLSYSVPSSCQYYYDPLCLINTLEPPIIHKPFTSSPPTKKEGYVKCTQTP